MLQAQVPVSHKEKFLNAGGTSRHNQLMEGNELIVGFENATLECQFKMTSTLRPVTIRSLPNLRPHTHFAYQIFK